MTSSATPPPAQPPAPRKKRNVGLWVALAVIFLGMASCLTSIFTSLPPGVEPQTVLELDFTGGVPERGPSGALDLALGGTSTTLRDITDALDRGAADENVVAVVAKIGAGGLGLGVTQELRDAVARFRASGKPAVAWSESLGGLVPGNGGYYLATAFDEIWLLPTGDVGLVGLSAEVPFLKGVFEKVGISPEMEARHEYKSMKNLFTESAFTEPHREMMHSLLTEQQRQLIAGIAEGRGKEPAAIEALLAEGPFPAPRAKELGLIDHTGYRDEVFAHLDELAGGEAKRLYVSPYLERAGRLNKEGVVVALIYATGSIQSGASDPLTGGDELVSSRLSLHLRTAASDDDVQAIVLRVDSPGGSHIASDVVRRAVEAARAAGKPVVASMGNMAGSGGYMIAMAADRIVAQPGTMTGSIGVVGGKLVPDGLFEKIGLTFEEIKLAPRAGMAAVSRGFDQEERVAFEASLDRIYDDFVSQAAKARGVSVEKLEPNARGRVWMGTAAKQRGLVDELGGLYEAVALARELASISPDADIELRPFPTPRRPVEAVLSLLEGRGHENSDNAGPPATRLVNLPPWWRSLRALALAPRAGVLEMPPFVHALEAL